MARNQDPVSDEAIAAAREDIQEIRSSIREYLADELGGDPEDYNAERYFADLADEPVTDGGE